MQSPAGKLSYGYNRALGYSQLYSTSPAYPIIKIGRIKRPSQIIMTGDADGDNYTTDDYNTLLHHSWNIIGNFHQKGAPLGFIDGHAEFKKRSEVTCVGAIPSNNSSIPGGAETAALTKMWGVWAEIYQ